jgi:hypothetical protein
VTCALLGACVDRPLDKPLRPVAAMATAAPPRETLWSRVLEFRNVIDFDYDAYGVESVPLRRPRRAFWSWSGDVYARRASDRDYVMTVGSPRPVRRAIPASSRDSAIRSATTDCVSRSWRAGSAS